MQYVLDRARVDGERAAVPHRHPRALRRHQGESGRRRLRASSRAAHRSPQDGDRARARAHAAGALPGGGAVVIAMGKLGGREMTAASDLDLILVYDFDAAAMHSTGSRPLAPTHYYTRLTQRLISALSSATAEGTLYEVDMRLRPSGQQGPVAAQLSTFIEYQANEAWTWEHLALTRARVVAGPPELKARVEAAIHAALTKPRDRAKVAADVHEMRQRIAKEKGTENIWELKQVRGGLVDLEFIAQYLQLVPRRRAPGGPRSEHAGGLPPAARRRGARSRPRRHSDPGDPAGARSDADPAPVPRGAFRPGRGAEGPASPAGAGRRCGKLCRAGGAACGRSSRRCRTFRRNYRLRGRLAGGPSKAGRGDGFAPGPPFPPTKSVLHDPRGTAVRGRGKARSGARVETEVFDGHAEARCGGEKGGAGSAREYRDGY